MLCDYRVITVPIAALIIPTDYADCHAYDMSQVRLPGTIDNQRLGHASSIRETCAPPFLQPTRRCKGDADGEPIQQPTIFDHACECEPVTDYQQGYDTESCGCQAPAAQLPAHRRRAAR